jgi:uncharacterized protein YjbI with pentapeptide repeats
MLVNDLKKKHTNKGLTDVETKILKGIFDGKTYRDLAEEIRQEEQSIKNAAYDLFKILSDQTGEKIEKSNLITALARARYRDNSQTFDHNNKPQTQQSNKVLELVIEVGIDELTPENNDKIISFLQKIARDETIKPIMKLKGSIRLFLEGSEDGLQRLADLHQSRELQALLNELKSDDIPEIIVKKAKFTTDAKVIEKAELIKAIREGTIHKTTLRFVDLSGANLSGADLIGANLIGANLKGAILSEAILIGANLSEANLKGANLSGANLSGANLSGANLSGANLKGADLRRAFLSEADLSGADLRGAKLWGANLSGAIKVLELVIEVEIDDLTPEKIDKINNLIQKIARDNTIKPIMKPKGSIRLFLEGSEDGLQRLADLHQSGELQALLNELKSDDIPEIIVTKAEFTTDAKVIEKAELIKAIREGTIDKTTLQQVDLSGAFLIGAILSEANLRGANLSDANLRWANLSDANLRWANLRGANLSGAILIEANLSAANLSGADLRKANLSDAILIEANLSKANLSGAKLREADLRKANLREANLSEANLIGAILREANLSGANLSDANLSGADVENAIFINATGITPEQKQDLIRRGAIFGDTSNDRSKALV